MWCEWMPYADLLPMMLRSSVSSFDILYEDENAIKHDVVLQRGRAIP
jgi:hypothetical protein